jgi:hypothetical protein
MIKADYINQYLKDTGAKQINSLGDMIEYCKWLEGKLTEARHELKEWTERPEKYDNDGFTTYDTSNGHCGLCGSLRCRGNCFK